MDRVKLLAGLGALMLSSLALADTTFVCGTAACSAFGNGIITGIDGLVVDGDHFDVTFSTTQSTTFAFSYDSAAPGQPLTGVDAANALDAFYATQHGPNPQDDGPGIIARVQGLGVVEVYNLVTAYQASTTPGVVDADITEPFLGGGGVPVKTVPDAGDGLPGPGQTVVSHDAGGSLCSFGTCTVWTRVAAPEIDPASATSAITLLFGGLTVLRGRKRA